ncbi:PREDICTED: putative uncharacterized protein encoded by LINC00476 isoform X2 [Cercocebus atys]|uniref:putative uncharacterized protein encoded by LINC00476 isoform X2 n=1 Tax=Cercocebus atys TaxID=9531 RepID=UPI0005F3CE5B|nr:PREDICTED: putative uncharacterized protein encoded by LINC00476 isoform X2 [Cercocebus atys]
MAANATSGRPPSIALRQPEAAGRRRGIPAKAATKGTRGEREGDVRSGGRATGRCVRLARRCSPSSFGLRRRRWRTRGQHCDPQISSSGSDLSLLTPQLPSRPWKIPRERAAELSLGYRENAIFLSVGGAIFPMSRPRRPAAGRAAGVASVARSEVLLGVTLAALLSGDSTGPSLACLRQLLSTFRCLWPLPASSKPVTCHLRPFHPQVYR